MEIEEKMEELYRYIWHQDKYKEEFLTALSAHLFLYCIVLIRKSLILYIYEKFEQIYKLGNEEALIEKWNKNGSLNNNRIGETTMSNFYFANKSQDDAVISFITSFYSIDQNYKNTLLSNSKAYRDAACHVSDTDIEKDITEEKIITNIEDTIKFIKRIENAHTAKYFQETETLNWVKNLSKLNLAAIEKKYLLNQLIEFLKNSEHFRDSETVEQAILNFKTEIKTQHISKILDIVFQNNPLTMNQVLYANGTANFLKKLYELEQNKGLDDKWKNFLQRIEKKAPKMSSSYDWLIH